MEISKNKLLGAECEIVHFAKPSQSHAVNVNYLGRYIKRPPIAQSRLVHYDGNSVIFKFLNRKNKKTENFICSTEDFIKRFIQHIPEKGFRLIRYYGFLANRVRKKLLPIIYKILNQEKQKFFPVKWKDLAKSFLGENPLVCILCKFPLKFKKIKVVRLRRKLSGLRLWSLKSTRQRMNGLTTEYGP